MAGGEAFRVFLCHARDLESGDRPIRCAGADLRYRGHLRDRHAAGGAGGVRDRLVPDRTLPADDEAADRCRRRTASRGAQHHLRYLGIVRAGARAAAARATVADRACRKPSRRRPPVQGAAVRNRHSDGRRGSRHHGVALHCGDHAGCFRHRASHAEGVGIWTRRHDLGGHVERGRTAFARRHRRRHHARFGTGAGRDHGRDLRDRQCASHQFLAVSARHDDILGDRQRVHGSGG